MIKKIAQLLKSQQHWLLMAIVCYVAALFLQYRQQKNNTEANIAAAVQQYVQRQQNAFEQLVNSKSFMLGYSEEQPFHYYQGLGLDKQSFGLFIFHTVPHHAPALVYWNNNRYVLPHYTLAKADSIWLANYQNGTFICLKKQLPGRIVVGMIPLRWHYFLENKYLQSEFAGLPHANHYVELNTHGQGIGIQLNNHKNIVWVKQKDGFSKSDYHLGAVLLVLAAVLFLFVLLHKVCIALTLQKQFTVAYSLLVVALLGFRILVYATNFPLEEQRLPLFDPSVYASNFIHPSLGDLLLNVVLIFWLVGFHKVYAPVNSLGNIHQRMRKPLMFLLMTLWTGITLLIVSVIKSLIQDGKISFDVTNFFSLNAFSIIGFLVLSFLVLIFFYISNIVYRLVLTCTCGLQWHVAAIVTGGFIWMILPIASVNTLNVCTIVWHVFMVCLLHYRQKDLHKPIIQSSFFIFWVMIFAVSVSVLVTYQNGVVELEQRKRMAERLSLQNDPNGENMLSLAVSNIDSTLLATNYTRFQNELDNKLFKDSIITANFSGYLNKFETAIYTFGSYKQPLYNLDSSNFSFFQSIIKNGQKGNISGLFTYQNPQDELCYLYEMPVTVKSDTVAFCFVSFKPKQYKSEAIYPELFKQEQDVTATISSNYAYAVYGNGHLLSKNNDYPFPNILPTHVANTSISHIVKTGFSELWFKGNNNRVVAVARNNTQWLEAATLFAYLFVIFLLVLVVFNTGNYLLKNGFTLIAFQKLFSFNIRSQIHATILFISVFSFLIIGIATISFFYERFEKNNRDKLNKTIQFVATQLQNKLSQTSEIEQTQPASNTYAGLNGSTIEAMITEMGENQNVDINLFNTQGCLVTSTQPFLYYKQLLSNRMDAAAYAALHDDKAERVIQNEQIGQLPYLSIYIPLTNNNGEAFAYLNIPYLNSQAELNQEISGFLATLINLNAIVFLLAGAIAFVITNKIVDGFAVISNKMNQIALGAQNEQIVWHKHDEIGILIQQYNKMVVQLERSALALARNEREGAWREMARQVAHEIKNPLTPMKLSIQFLQRAIDNDAPNTKELTKRVTLTLVEQIDQLAKIAGDFSQFANIGNAQPELLVLQEVIDNVVQLHSHSDAAVTVGQVPEGIQVLADKVQLTRLLTNLVKNAIEAPREQGQSVTVQLAVQQLGQQAIITVTDNGDGIPLDMQHKIFTPNFTTKNSGTGLGLAICKGIVEKMNGTIGFTTQAQIGTAFTVSLPLSSEA